MLVSKYPISKEEALKYKAKEINITNNSTCDTAYYKVTIKDLVNSSINKDKINYQVVDKSTNKETIDKNPDNFNISDSLTKGNTKTYTIRLWIDESATNTDLFINGDTTKPIEYKYALNIESSDEELKGNITPALEFALAKVGTDGLEQITHTIDNTLQVDNNFATEYRYRGGDSIVKNYVTFNNEIWRIIGIIPTEDTNGNVENRFKIIKDESIGNMYWNDCATSDNEKCDDTGKDLLDWTEATLNIHLNTIYYNSLSSEAQNIIGTTKYYLGGFTINASPVINSTMWQYERKIANENKCDYGCYFHLSNPIMQSDASKKIALMYTSDYAYATSNECDSVHLVYYKDNECSSTVKNWLAAKKEEKFWLLTLSPGTTDVEIIDYDNDGINSEVPYSYEYGGPPPEVSVKPVLSLSPSVKITSGIGTSSSPYTLSVK